MKFVEMIKNNKKLEIGIYIVLALIAIIVYFSASNGKAKNNDVSRTTQNNGTIVTEAEVEARLEKTLMKIRGAGEVSVMITYDTSSEIVPALSSTEQENTASGGSRSSSNQPATVVTSGDEEAIVLLEIQPKVRGVIVVAQGAADINVRLNLEYAVSAVLGIDQSCIEVFEMGNVNIDKQ